MKDPRIRAVLAGGLLAVALLLAGCPAPPPAPKEGPSVPRGGTAPAPPMGSPTLGPSGAPVPAMAVQQRGRLLRTWAFYFAGAASPSIGFGQIHQESTWVCSAVSGHGALGCAQFMPKTAEWIQGLLPAEVQAACGQSQGCPLDPAWAIEAMSKFDRLLWGEAAYATSATDRWQFALSGYNGGSGWVSRERQAATAQGLDASKWSSLDTVCLRAAAACRENREYPRRILERWAPLYAAWLGRS